MALPALAGAAATAGLAGIGDLLFSLLARKGGRKATSSVLKQILGKQAANPTQSRSFLKRAGRGAAKFGGVFGGIELALQSIGGPEEQNSLAAQHNLPTLGKDNQIDAQLEQLLAHLLANSEQEPFL